MHGVAVLLANMHHVLSELRAQQAADALEHALGQELAQKRAAIQALSARAQAARQAAARAAAALPPPLG